MRAFGHFEKPLFIELCKHVETKFVPAGAILFRPGQIDDSIYVVKNGRLKVRAIIIENLFILYITLTHFSAKSCFFRL